MNPTMLPGVEFQFVAGPLSASSSADDNSVIIDMSGYEGVLFVQPISDSAATGVATITIEQNDSNSDAGMAALVGGAAAVTSLVNDDINNQLLIAEVYRPRKRFVQAVRTSSGANIAYGRMIAILYGRIKKPVIQGATVAASVVVTSPDES